MKSLPPPKMVIYVRGNTHLFQIGFFHLPKRGRAVFALVIPLVVTVQIAAYLAGRYGFVSFVGFN